MQEELPLARVQRAVIDFLRDRNDVALFGAQAVNAYVDQPRMSEDVDVLAVDAAGFAEALKTHLHKAFDIAVRVRDVRGGFGHRVYQLRRGKPNRHLVDVVATVKLPPTQQVEGVAVVAPLEAVIGKVRSSWARRNKPKGFTDRRDLAMLLQAFPELLTSDGAVAKRLAPLEDADALLAHWQSIVQHPLDRDDEESEFNFDLSG